MRNENKKNSAGKNGRAGRDNIYDIINKNNRKSRGDYSAYEDGYERGYDNDEENNFYGDVLEDNEEDEFYEERYDEQEDGDFGGYEEDEDFGEYGNFSDKRYMKKKKKSLVKKFFIIVFSILFVYIAVFGGYIAYTYFDSDPDNDYFGKDGIIDGIGRAITSDAKLPDRVNVLLMGVDEDYSRDGVRTDTIMVASFDSVNKKLSLISIPRDTSVEIPSDRFEVMKENFPELGSDRVKINSVYLYGGEKGLEFLRKQIEDILDIEIDYYMKINFKGFISLIDSIGGVKFNVAQRCYYNDYEGFVVDLYPGEQILDGKKAIQLVRFRSGYARADLQRIEVQRDFLKAFLTQAMAKESVMSNPRAYIDTVIEYVETDIKIGDIPAFINAVKDLDMNNFKGYTLPGEPAYRGGVSYYVYNEEETKKMMDEIYGRGENSITQNKEEEDSKNKRIVVLNGGKTTGLAKKASELLKGKSFNVVSYANAEKGAKNTEIYVKKRGWGKDLTGFFTASEIITNENKCNDKACDILIVLGENEKLTGDKNG